MPDANFLHGNPDQGRRVSVIVCAYTERRWYELNKALDSLQQQARLPDEIVLVIDHNPALYQRALAQWPGVKVLENQQARGLSGARNSGIAAASGDILAFMDDDAIANPDWLERLLAGYARPGAAGVGGAIQPLWQGQRPAWFPEEFAWVVGCTYKGMPERPAPVRNLIGANMSFDRSVFAAAGEFQTGLGRLGTLPLGCEETELCIRYQQRRPGSQFWFEPEAVVRHLVPASRASLRYFLSRCFSEGISKAAVSRLVGAQDGLSNERAYTLRTLPGGVLRGVFDGLRGRLSGFGRAAAIVLGLGVTGLGFLWGKVAYRPGKLRVGQAESPLPPLPRGAKRVAEGLGLSQKDLSTGSSNPLPQRENNALEVLPPFSMGVGGDSSLSPIPLTGLPAKRRILMVTPRFFPEIGGVESHVYQVARRLAQRGAEITVLATDRSGKLPERETLEGIQIRRVPAWPRQSDLFFAPGIYDAVRGGEWDLVHIQSYHTFVPPLAMLAALRAGIPYVVTFHGGGHSERLRNAVRGMQRASLGPLLRRAARLVAVASFEIRQYGQELGVPASRFALIPNGADLPAPPAPRAPGHRAGARIASVGRLERYKGHHRLIAAMPRILQSRPDATLWIAGSGPYEGELRRLAQRCGVQDQVRIEAVPAAERERMAAELSQANLFVLLSEFETHPVAVLEALSLGVPALVTDTSGLGELAGQGLARAISPGSTTQEIAQAVLDELDHPYPPAAAFRLPTWDDCSRQLWDLYEDIIESTSGGIRLANSDAQPVLSAHPGRD